MHTQDKPYTRKEMVEKKDAQGYVAGTFEVPLSDLVHRDEEGLRDHLAVCLTGSENVHDLLYEIVGHKDYHTLYLRVSANIEDLLQT